MERFLDASSKLGSTRRHARYASTASAMRPAPLSTTPILLCASAYVGRTCSAARYARSASSTSPRSAWMMPRLYRAGAQPGDTCAASAYRSKARSEKPATLSRVPSSVSAVESTSLPSACAASRSRASRQSAMPSSTRESRSRSIARYTIASACPGSATSTASSTCPACVFRPSFPSATPLPNSARTSSGSPAPAPRGEPGGGVDRSPLSPEEFPLGPPSPCSARSACAAASRAESICHHPPVLRSGRAREASAPSRRKVQRGWEGLGAHREGGVKAHDGLIEFVLLRQHTAHPASRFSVRRCIAQRQRAPHRITRSHRTASAHPATHAISALCEALRPPPNGAVSAVDPEPLRSRAALSCK